MSIHTLEHVLMTKEAAIPLLRRGILKSLGLGSGTAPRAFGAAVGTTAAIPLLEAAGLAQNNPLLWGLTGGAGVMGHDIAGALASKRYNKFLKSVSN